MKLEGRSMANRHGAGEANANALLDSRTVREIRLLHFCDGVSASQIARDLQIHLSGVSRIVNFRAWKHQDDDLRGLPKPRHKGGGAYHQPKPEGVVTLEPVQKRTCRDCLHLTNGGRCGFGFPECISSAFKEAARCNAFAPIKPGAAATVQGDAGGSVGSGC